MENPAERISTAGAPSGNRVTALLLSDAGEDYTVLKEIFRRAEWQLYYAHHFSQALRCLRQHRMPVLICDCGLAPGNWDDALGSTGQLDRPPVVIATAKGADEQLRSDALARGAFDVLSKPFDQDEVLRVISTARQHWQERNAGGTTLEAHG